MQCLHASDASGVGRSVSSPQQAAAPCDMHHEGDLTGEAKPESPFTCMTTTTAKHDQPDPSAQPLAQSHKHAVYNTAAMLHRRHIKYLGKMPTAAAAAPRQAQTSSKESRGPRNTTPHGHMAASIQTFSQSALCNATGTLTACTTSLKSPPAQPTPRPTCAHPVDVRPLHINPTRPPTTHPCTRP
jgi:hypothetical protein